MHFPDMLRCEVSSRCGKEEEIANRDMGWQYDCIGIITVLGLALNWFDVDESLSQDSCVPIRVGVDRCISKWFANIRLSLMRWPLCSPWELPALLRQHHLCLIPERSFYLKSSVHTLSRKCYISSRFSTQAFTLTVTLLWFHDLEESSLCSIDFLTHPPAQSQPLVRMSFWILSSGFRVVYSAEGVLKCENVD